jgi:hypothetical protein
MQDANFKLKVLRRPPPLLIWSFGDFLIHAFLYETNIDKFGG